MEIYQVIIQDEWNNLYNIGFYKELKTSVLGINKFLEDYDANILEEELNIYPSTFGYCFDLDIKSLERYEENEDIPSLYIRGFIFEIDVSLMELVS